MRDRDAVGDLWEGVAVLEGGVEDDWGEEGAVVVVLVVGVAPGFRGFG